MPCHEAQYCCPIHPYADPATKFIIPARMCNWPIYIKCLITYQKMSRNSKMGATFRAIWPLHMYKLLLSYKQRSMWYRYCIYPRYIYIYYWVVHLGTGGQALLLGLSHEFKHLFLYGPTAAFIPTNLLVRMQLLVHSKIYCWISGSAITLLLYTC